MPPALPTPDFTNDAETDLVYPPRNRRTHMVAQHITGMISDGTLVPGARLPNETDLCSHFNVSRTTLREAIQTLRAKGLLDVSPGRGSFIRRPELRERLGELALALNLNAPIPAAESAGMISGLLLQAAPVALQAPLAARQQLFRRIVIADSLPVMNLELEHGWQRAFVALGQPQPGPDTAALPQAILTLLQMLQTPGRLAALAVGAVVSRSSYAQLQATTALVEDDAEGLAAALRGWLLTA